MLIRIDERYFYPIFRKDIIPFNVEGYIVKIPTSKSRNISFLKDSVYRPINITDLQAEPVLNLKDLKQDSNARKNVNINPEKKFTKKKLIYKVKKGDNISDLADCFDVTPTEIKSWNKVKSNNLKFGQNLTLWVEGNKLGYYKKINKMTQAQKKKLRAKD